ncbi:MAG: hypothetical protein EOP85_07335 [Verrucomicrobiaceae bacterium]|nr:MAG: hypothetical protein EOP85_07335 [Verrucomicrobiaceae bacterium]
MKEKELSLSGMSHKGVHDRGYLPHWDFGNSVQAITFRLADSLPQKILKGWREELRVALGSPDSETSRMAQADLYRRISRYEDAGHGACLLNNPDHAEAVQDLLIKGHGSAYRLIEWCIMPNHVHVLVRLLGDTPLGSVIKKWKGASAILINRLEERGGSVWMADYHDRLVRNMDHFHDVRAYIRRNPVKAGLCEEPEEWRFSSAGAKWNGELAREETGTRGIDSALPVSGSALSGHLDLRCELRSDGVPFVSRQSFRAPIHLSKSHLDQGHLVQSIVNPTAGFFDGDELRINVEVEAGARLVLSTPSASRVYRTRSGEAAKNKQNFTVGENAMLEWIPEPFIPHAGARYVQRTLLDLHPSASLLFFDWIAPT